MYYLFNNILHITDSLEDNLNKLFNSSFEEIFRQFETEFLNNNENINNSNIFIGKFLWYYILFLSAVLFYFSVPINAENDVFSQSPNEKEHNKNKIPKKNFMARNYFLKQRYFYLIKMLLLIN